MRLFNDILNILFPRVCCACGKSLSSKESYICFGCRSQMPKAHYKDLTNNELTERFYGKLNIQFASAYLLFHKSGITQKLLHTVKYADQPELGELLGSWFGFELAEKEIFNKSDLIIPVPLHSKRRRQRGYNQSNFIARGISSATNIPVMSRVLQRIHYEESQTHKSKEQRWQNVADSFEIIDNRIIEQKRILLVDDVITTGATLSACGNKLLSAGAKEIAVVALAIAK